MFGQAHLSSPKWDEMGREHSMSWPAFMDQPAILESYSYKSIT